MRAVLIKGDKGPASAMHIGWANKPVPKKKEVLVKVSTSRLALARLVVLIISAYEHQIKAIGVNRMDGLQRTGNVSPIKIFAFSFCLTMAFDV